MEQDGASGDVFSSRSYVVTKHSWKGKYKRVFTLGPIGISTLNPSSMDATNRWAYPDLVSILPAKAQAANSSSDALEFQVSPAQSPSMETEGQVYKLTRLSI